MNETGVTRIEQKTKEVERILSNQKAWVSLVKKYVNPIAFMRVLSTEIQVNPKLADCSTQSIVNSFLYCAQINLMPGSATKEVYLVPFAETCTPILGYQGEIKLMERHESILKIEARAVYKKEEDTFRAKQGTESVIIHPYRLDLDRHPDNLIAVYAVAFYQNGSHKCAIMSRQQVDQHRARSRASSKGPWVTDYVAMALKTVIHELADLVPKEYQAAVAMTADEAADRGESAVDIVLGADQYKDVPEEPAKSQAEDINERVKSRRGRPPKPTTPSQTSESAATGQTDGSQAKSEPTAQPPKQTSGQLNLDKMTEDEVAAAEQEAVDRENAEIEKECKKVIKIIRRLASPQFLEAKGFINLDTRGLSELRDILITINEARR